MSHTLRCRNGEGGRKKKGSPYYFSPGRGELYVKKTREAHVSLFTDIEGKRRGGRGGGERFDSPKEFAGEGGWERGRGVMCAFFASPRSAVGGKKERKEGAFLFRSLFTEEKRRAEMRGKKRRKKGNRADYVFLPTADRSCIRKRGKKGVEASFTFHATTERKVSCSRFEPTWLRTKKRDKEISNLKSTG